MSDPAHQATDAIIAKIEKDITKEYKKAHKEVTQKLDDYLARFATKDKKWQEWVANGTKTAQEYKDWKMGQILVGQRWADLKDSLAKDYGNAAKISQSIANGYRPEVYALNHNYSTFEIEKKSKLNTSYTLYSRESVERMYRENPRLYHKPGQTISQQIKEGKLARWDKRRIQSVLMQGILQGESIPNLTQRLEKVTGGDHKAAIRNIRTMMTGVQNAGRVDAQERAKSMGIPVKKQWLATLDSRTRHWHRDLDGEVAETDEPFENEIGKIMFPGDPDADPANIYNCRCTLLSAIEDHTLEVTDDRLEYSDEYESMTYEDWLESKKSYSNPITLPEEKAAAIKQSYINEYAGGHGGPGGQHAHTAKEGAQIAQQTAQAQMDQINQNEYSGIWKDPVKPSDYADKKEAISAKQKYFDDQLALAKQNGWTAKEQKFTQLKADLADFEEKGKEYEKAKTLRDSFGKPGKLSKVKTADTSVKTGPFSADAYSDARKKAAKRFYDRDDADKYFRPDLDKNWDNLTEYEKYSVWKYTENSNPINKPLSGYHDGWGRSDYIGPLKTDWGHEDSWRTLRTSSFKKKFAKKGTTSNVDHHEVIKNLTTAIDKSALKEDSWFVRGSDKKGLAGLLEGSEYSFEQATKILETGDTATLRKAFKGKVFQGHSFLSTGIAKGSGFSGDCMYDIYAPAGTKCIYAEPASYYGNTITGEQIYKKGKAYSSVGSEAENIFQRGTFYRMADITKDSSGRINPVLEVVDQPNYFKTGAENTFDGGKTLHMT